MFFNNKKRQFVNANIEVLIHPIFLEMKLEQVSFDELGRQTLMVYYYGLLTHLAESMDVSSKILQDEFRTTLQDTFQYDVEEAITWQFSIQEALENDSYDTTTTFFQHGYDAYPLIENHKYDAIKEDYTALVNHLQVFESENLNMVVPDIPSKMSPISLINEPDNLSSNVVEYKFDQKLIDELMINNWGAKYPNLSTDDLTVIADVMNTLEYENQELEIVNDTRSKFRSKPGGDWNYFAEEYRVKWKRKLTKAIRVSLSKKLETKTKKDLQALDTIVTSIEYNLAHMIIASAALDVSTIRYYEDLKNIFLDGYLNLDWQGKYPEGQFDVFKK